MQARIPLQNSHVLAQLILDYLDLYKKYRERKWESSATGVFVQKVIYAWETGKRVLTSEKPVADQIDELVNSMSAEALSAKDFENWYALIFKFRQQAEVAQGLKTVSGSSKLFETFHGCASLIICFLKDSNDTASKFFAKIQHLKKSLKDEDAYEDFCISDRQGEGLDASNEKQNQYILELALLGEIKFINQALKLHAIDANLNAVPLLNLKIYPIPLITELQEFNCLDTASHRTPLCLQQRYGEWLYVNSFQPITQYSFDDYKRRAAKSAFSRIEKRADEEARKKAEEAAREEEDHKKSESGTQNGASPESKNEPLSKKPSASKLGVFGGAGQETAATPKNSPRTEKDTLHPY